LRYKKSIPRRKPKKRKPNPTIRAMNKSLFTILAVCSMVVSAHAQYFILDSGLNIGDGSSPTATTGGLVWLDPDGNLAHATLDTTQDINLGLLWGTSAASVTTRLNIDPMNLDTGGAAGSGNWIAGQLTGEEDISGYGSGAILDPNGNSYFPPGEAVGSTVWLVIQGWTGSSTTYSNALAAGGLRGQTAPFSVTLVQNTSVFPDDAHTMSALVLSVPEPSLPALTALGGVAFALLRRRN